MPLNLDVPVDRLSLSEKAYNILKDQIIRGHLAPGEKLDIQELALDLHISRTPVKEAIHRLSLQGLVTICSRKSTCVSVWDGKKVRDLFDFRLLLEIGAAEHALSLPSALNLLQMQRVLHSAGAVFAASGEFDYFSFTSLDQQFHGLIIEAAHNSQLELAYDSLNAHVQVMRVYWGRARDRALRSHKEHLRVLDAFQKGNIAAVRRSLSVHIRNTRDDVLRILPSLHPPGRNGDDVNGRG